MLLAAATSSLPCTALQLVGVKQELAVRVAELTHVSTSLQEHKDSLAHTRSQLATVQDNLGGQLRALQRELSATQAEKLQVDREVGRLQQEGGLIHTVPGMCVDHGLREQLVAQPVAYSTIAVSAQLGR
jgi:phage-related minor tail protein